MPGCRPLRRHQISHATSILRTRRIFYRAAYPRSKLPIEIIPPAICLLIRLNFTFPLTFAQERDIKSKLNGGNPTVGAYYAASLNSGAFAETYFPSMEANPALFVA